MHIREHRESVEHGVANNDGIAVGHKRRSAPDAPLCLLQLSHVLVQERKCCGLGEGVGVKRSPKLTLREGDMMVVKMKNNGQKY